MRLPLLALFYGRLGDSRLEELEACAERAGSGPRDWPWRRAVFRTHGGDEGPAVLQPLPPLALADQAWLAAAAQQAVGCRGVFEVWGAGDDIASCAAATEAVSVDWLRQRIDGPWRVEFVVTGARHSQHGTDPAARIRHFGHVLDALEDRPVRLRGPAHRVWLIEDRRVIEGGHPLPDRPPRFHLALQLPSAVADTQAALSRLDLRRRAFLGTSTLAADRALLLCNLGLATTGSGPAAVLDPFCGSGGVLLAAAALGAATVGSDIDWRLVSDNRVPIEIPATAHRPARGVEAVRMTDNFDEAGLPHPRALLALDVEAPDAAERLLEAHGGKRYDALVTDPPYGRREFQRGTGAWDGALTFRVDTDTLTTTLGRLMALAQQVVRPGGRLVFLAPVRAPRDPSKPTVDALRSWLTSVAPRHQLRLCHLAEARVHGGLHRATVVLERTVQNGTTSPA